MRRDWVIVHDDRERRPLLFPANMAMLDPVSKTPTTVRLSVVKARLTTADYLLTEDTPYTLSGSSKALVVERKMTLDEIGQKLQDPHGFSLFDAQLGRMAKDYAFPVLLLESTPTRFNVPTGKCPVPGIVHDLFQRLLLKHRVSLQYLPCPGLNDRRAMGEWVARLLINAHLMENPPETPANG